MENHRRSILAISSALLLVSASCALFDFDEFDLSNPKPGEGPIVFSDPPDADASLRLEIVSPTPPIAVRAHESSNVQVRVIRPTGFQGEVSVSQIEPLPSGLFVDPAKIEADKDITMLTIRADGNTAMRIESNVVISAKAANLSGSLSFRVSVLPGAGDFDPTFADGGVFILTDVGSAVDLASSRNGGDHRLIALTSSSVIAFDTSGALDPSFGDAGIRAPAPSGVARHSLVIHDDGQIAIGAERTDAISVTRLFKSGASAATTDIPAQAPSGAALLAANDGGVFVASSVGSPNRSVVAISLDPQGNVNSSFGDAGVAQFTLRAPAVHAITRNGDAILLGGSVAFEGLKDPLDPTSVTSVRWFSIFRSDSSGRFDPLEEKVNVSGDGRILALAHQPDRRRLIAVGESDINPTTKQLTMACFDVDTLKLDRTFGDFGIVRVTTFDSSWAEDVAVDSQGRILVVGAEVTKGTQQYLLLRFDPDGRLDPKFGGNPSPNFIGNESEAVAIVLREDQPIVLGRAVIDGKSSMFLARYHAK